MRASLTRRRTERVLQAVEDNCAGADPGVRAPEVPVVLRLLVQNRIRNGDENESPDQRLQERVDGLDDPVARYTRSGI